MWPRDRAIRHEASRRTRQKRKRSGFFFLSGSSLLSFPAANVIAFLKFCSLSSRQREEVNKGKEDEDG